MTTTPSPSCPDADTLVALVERALSPGDLATIEAHVDGCPQCRATIGHLAAVDDPVDAGTIGRYRLDEILGQGGMGVVWKAWDPELGRPLAIKLLRPEVTQDELRARFEREVRITARLQHPSTIAVLEAGTRPSGERYYVMNLIAGRSLDKVIAARSSVEERFGLIGNVLAVVDTMAYAHHLRIIHRDLKPANVLIGDYGETVVIDWGLAKDLAAADADDDVAVGPYRGVAGETVAGAVMGTPAYMPPEQARGEAVDERADVYALGALLYHVLAGAPPYRGASAAAVVAAVIAGPLPALAEVAPATPPDLVTIVETAMARDAADRYPTAKELAGELRRFQTGQLVGRHRYTAGELFRRWLRRHRAAVAVAAVAAAVLTAVGVVSVARIVDEQRRAEAARAVAETQRGLAEARGADAEELMGFMLGDLRDRLKPIGKLDLLELVARKAIGYYAGRADATDPRQRGQRATALRTIGDVLLTKGDLPGALAADEEALAASAALAAADPASLAWRSDVAESHRAIGWVRAAQGDAKAARAAIERALAELTRVPTAALTGDAARQLAATHRELGDTLVDLGDVAGAATHFRAAIALGEAQAARAPDDVRWQRVIAVNHSQLAGALLLQGDVPGALAENRADVAITERLAAATPSDTEVQSDLAGGHARIGDVLRSRGDDLHALAEYRVALAIATRLTDGDPANAGWQQDRAVSHDRVGAMMMETKDLVGALAQFQAGMAIKQRLVDKDPTNRASRRNLAIGHQRLGNVAERQGKLATAIEAYQTSRRELEALTAEDPANTGWQRDLAVAHYLVGDAELAAGDAAAALIAHRASLAISLRLVAVDPANAVWQGDVIDTHGELAKVLRALHQPAAARAELEAALAVATAQVARDPAEPAWAAQVTALRAALAGPAPR